MNAIYTTGQFAALAHVTKKTLRYYDEHNILKPSHVTESGARFYSEQDLAKMQQILLLKYLGFSLADIREMTIASETQLLSSLTMQKKLIDDRVEQLQLVSAALSETAASLENNKAVDWSHMLQVVHAMGMEQSLKTQYQNASNISARIQLHEKYAVNTQGWFPWIYEQCNIVSGMKILEVGCGDGTFWVENAKRLEKGVEIVVSDYSPGMLRDAQRAIGEKDERFSFDVFNCAQIPYADETFDLVIANHVLFYCNDIVAVCREVRRVLKNGGTFICSTYGKNHMREISELVRAFDDRITLSAQQLFENFGRENGRDILSAFFTDIDWKSYEDHLLVPDVDPIVFYILSCHGNQTQYILDRYKEFRNHVKKNIGKGFYISKDAGVFVCVKW